MKLTRYKDEYIEFVDRLASKIVRVGATRPLPEIPSLPPLNSIENPFRVAESIVPGATLAKDRGPNTARFVFVAGTRFEMSKWRRVVEAYSDHGAWYWKPFCPHNDRSVGNFAQSAATDLELRYHELGLTDQLVSHIEDCARANEAVILLIDPWTLQVESYCAVMRAIDRATFINCAVLILWNGPDEEMNAAKTELKSRLRQAFPQKLILRPPAHDWDSIQSPGELRQNLKRALNKVRMMILQIAEPERSVFDSELRRRAQEHGIAVESKPMLQGPVGAT